MKIKGLSVVKSCATILGVMSSFSVFAARYICTGTFTHVGSGVTKECKVGWVTSESQPTCQCAISMEISGGHYTVGDVKIYSGNQQMAWAQVLLTTEPGGFDKWVPTSCSLVREVP